MLQEENSLKECFNPYLVHSQGIFKTGGDVYNQVMLEAGDESWRPSVYDVLQNQLQAGWG